MIGQAFGMSVITWSQNLTEERALEFNAELVTKDTLFAEADVVTIHLQLSDRTRGLVGSKEFALMKSNAYLINTSRGPIVDEPALITALQEGWINGAGLDVYDEEPLAGSHPLTALKNTILTPHLGYVTEEGYRVFYAQTVEDIQAYLAGENPLRLLNPAVLGRERNMKA
jgi:phosphoglycerate dehydrogenase-like enzyme